MRLYHTTTREAAAAILAAGFRDGRGTYLTATEHTGVWLADSPLDVNDMGGDGRQTFVLAVDLPVSEAELAEFEWIEEGKPYREWLAPAAFINQRAKVELDEAASWDEEGIARSLGVESGRG